MVVSRNPLIHPTAIVDDGAKIGENWKFGIGHMSVLEQ